MDINELLTVNEMDTFSLFWMETTTVHVSTSSLENGSLLHAGKMG